MADLPRPGTRVSLRYRLPAGSVPPLNDVVGHLLDRDPVRVRTKTGETVEISPADVVSVRTLTDVPVKASQIRAVEHAAALGWPGLHREWLGGWLLRASDGYTHRGNSAVPLDINASTATVPAIRDWYARRGLTPWLAVPDRLVRMPQSDIHLESIVMVRTLPAEGAPEVTLTAEPDGAWLAVYEREVPVEVLTAVVDGQVAFGRIDDAAVGRGAVTPAHDGTRWVGLSAVRVAEDRRRRGHARAVCAALLAWGARSGATNAYAQVLADNAGAIALYESMGFTAQHRERYVDASKL
ncbi:N-acetylglutamate synthase, CG3035 family [Mycolicibacterium litorale]|uniref:N-acetyltransferase n=1 Tax=Mycolicibacterium litorale TaxID=758802 RepID=A0AAD1ILD5_9MYCO|nr:GNAT family N-acetyltransferase [Mycolicibacterium litorale]MCV7416776.1 GNAT family N-acetyltransferase [Mycolicibacterium litorale]TDY04561.1 acetyltransferase (GNAT) family protein [Mycolicibacterium litorale]BBY17987.1 N-acetyltransferase [Mycolicibacterium litorale]